MGIYIRSYGIISPQDSFAAASFPENAIHYETDRMPAVEPTYSDFIDPRQLRRMSRNLKMALVTSQACIERAGSGNPDAIVVGTGLGSVAYLEKFIFEMEDKKETALSPTPFMQSTHNQIASQIAIQTKNHNYNSTYCHRAISFEWALLDAMMLVRENSAHNILVGGLDVMTENIYTVYNHLGYWKNDNPDSRNLLYSKTTGTLFGEGAAFFLLTDGSRPGGIAMVKDVGMFFNPGSERETEKEISFFLEKNKLGRDEIDLVIFGINGDHPFDRIYHHLMANFFNGIKTQYTYFKHLSGEYFTASSFAFWLAAVILKEGVAPEAVKINEVKQSLIQNVLIYNHYRNADHSLILLGRE